MSSTWVSKINRIHSYSSAVHLGEDRQALRTNITSARGGNTGLGVVQNFTEELLSGLRFGLKR